jgi:hypothetical protein
MAIFTFNNPSGSSYFTVETVRNSSGVYDSTSNQSAVGTYSNFSNLNGDHLVTSSYIFSIPVPNGTGSFTFNPSYSVFGTSSVYIRGTGEFTATVSTYSGSFTLTPAQMYGAGILNTFALTPIPAFQSRVSADSGSYEAFECQNNVFANTPVNILQTASLLLTPNAFKEGKLYSTLPENGNGDFTVTRATTATRVNSTGLVELVPYNLLLNTNTFSSWSLEGGTLTSGQIDPLGGNSAYKYVQASGGLWSNSVLDVNQTKVTYSFWAKSVYGGNLNMRLADGGGFNSYGIITINGNWTYYTFTLDRTYPTTGGMYLYAIDNSQGFYIWHPQINVGTSAKEYFPTTDRLDVPRLDYSNGTCPSLLVEPQRTNLALYSQEFDNAYWTKFNCTITTNNAVAPDGTNSADRLVLTSISPNAQTLSRQSPIVTTTTTVTFSTFVKYVDKQYIQLVFSGGFSLQFANFDLINGIVTDGTYVSANVQSYANGWYRISITTTGSNTFCLPFIWAIDTALALRASDSTSTGTSAYLIWGAQVEDGSYPTSYIPTTSASVTRNADQVFKTGISSLIGQFEGTIYWEGIANYGVFPKSNVIIDMRATSGYLLIEVFDTGYIQVSSTGFGSNLLSSVPLPLNTNSRIALTYKAGNWKLYLNGVQVASSTAAIGFSDLNTLYIGYINPAAGYLEKTQVKCVSLWKEALNDEQLESLTGTGFNSYAEMASYYNYTLQ